MKHRLSLVLFVCGILGCNGQEHFGTENLVLKKTIEMPGISGRIDHIAINLKDNILYVAALGNNSVEVIDLSRGSLLHSIEGLDEPQGVAYVPETNELVVANGGNGKCIFYNTSGYQQVATVDLGSDADNVRYNPVDGKIFVGYGNGGIAVIDAITHKELSKVELSAHPESFQIDQKNNLLFVNLPDNNSIARIDLKNLRFINTWKTDNMSANFPMALDTAGNTVIIGYRRPAMLVCYDALTGKEKSRTDLISDVDDLFYYPAKQEIIASGGGGAVNVFKKENDGSYKKIANIPTRSGARTSLLIPSLQTLILAERASGSKTAALAVYKIED
jgi:DNA-binding beta-propeller fold protein YncE